MFEWGVLRWVENRKENEWKMCLVGGREKNDGA